VYAMNFIDMNKLLLLVLQVAAGAVVYVLVSIIMRNENFKYFCSMFKKLLKRGAK